MLTAKEAKERTKKAIEAEEASRKARVEAFCEAQAKDIEEVCDCRGNTWIVKEVPQGWREMVVNYFRFFGYEVKALSNTTIQLIW